MIDLVVSLTFGVLLAIPMWFIGYRMGSYEDQSKKTRECPRNYNVWIHLPEKDFKDADGVLHQKFMCPKCGLIHEFLDGHTSQYNYCPHCGLYLGP